MGALTVGKTLPAIAQDIQREHDAGQRDASNAVKHAIQCGRLLLQQKAAMKHGEFGKWIEANVSFSRDAAVAYMRAASAPNEILTSGKNLTMRMLRTLPKNGKQKKKTTAPKPRNKDAQAKRILCAIGKLQQSDLSNPQQFAEALFTQAHRLATVSFMVTTKRKA